MQELEKILEEIELEKKRLVFYPDCSSAFSSVQIRTIEKIEQIICKYMSNCKHMNDDWISVDDRLPEKNECFVETSGDKDFPNGYYKRLEIAYMTDTIEYVHGYYDGYKWMDKYLDTIKNVVAWRIHEPYRPERSDGE